MPATAPARHGIIKFILLVLFVGAAFTAVRALGLGEYLSEERLRPAIEAAGVWGPLVYILVYSVAPSLLLPGLPLTVAGGVLFGPVWGVVYTAAGANIGAAIAFLIARYMGRDWVGAMLGGSRWQELDREVERQGWKIVAFTRLVPVFPFNILNYAFGLTRIRFTHFAAASFVFMMPGITAYVVFSSSLLDLFHGRVSKKFLAGIVLIVLISVVSIVYRKRRKKSFNNGRFTNEK